MSKWYVGIKGTHRDAFPSAIPPTESTHGDRYAAVIGPFRTKRAALWAESQAGNPHFQSVEDAERISKQTNRNPRRAILAAHARGVRNPRAKHAARRKEKRGYYSGHEIVERTKHTARAWTKKYNYKLQHFDGKAWHVIGVATITAANLAALKKKAHYFIKMGMKNKMRIIKD